MCHCTEWPSLHKSSVLHSRQLVNNGAVCAIPNFLNRSHPCSCHVHTRSPVLLADTHTPLFTKVALDSATQNRDAVHITHVNIVKRCCWASAAATSTISVKPQHKQAHPAHLSHTPHVDSITDIDHYVTCHHAMDPCRMRHGTTLTDQVAHKPPCWHLQPYTL